MHGHMALGSGVVPVAIEVNSGDFIEGQVLNPTPSTWLLTLDMGE